MDQVIQSQHTLYHISIILIIGKQRKKTKSKTKSTGSSSTSSRISTAEILNIVDKLKHEQHRSTTKKNYYAVWKVFNNFFISLGDKPIRWEDRLTLFVGYLVHNHRQSSTVRSYVSAVKAVLKMNNINISED